jgi:sterol desaturase/sphingolipid hydroxylase (fatty acid hydroxylase superfamily)
MDFDQDLIKVVHDALYYVVFHLTRAVLAFLQPDSYLYWPFLISSLVIVYIAARSELRGFVGFFSPKLWWHPSARADYRLYLANALLFPLLVAPLLVKESHISSALDALFGLKNASAGLRGEEQMLVLRILFTLSFFLLYDLGRFIAHSLLHDVPALWEFHKVHHSAAVLTPMTAYRAHPLELMLMAWIPTVLTGFGTWLFNIAGAQVNFYSFLGLHIAIWGFNLVDNLRHSPTWVSYGPAVGKWLISPAHHQLHHSFEQQHLGCNRGSNLAIWDRMYGTLYVPNWQPERFRMGLGDNSEACWNGIARMYLLPVANCVRLMRDMLWVTERKTLQISSTQA